MTTSAQSSTSRSRRLRHGRSEMRLAPDATVTWWTSHDEGLPPLVTPASSGSGLGFIGVEPDRASPEVGTGARTRLVAACGTVEVWDRLTECAEPVGRASPGVALARRVRCLDGPLDVVHRVRLAHTSSSLSWRPLNRVVFGYFGDRKVTVDGGDVQVAGTDVTSRLISGAAVWTVLTVAFDGHLPARDAPATCWSSR
jgi:hypothetical protein